MIPRIDLFTPMSSFGNHSAIRMIKNKYQNSFNCKFEPVSVDQVIKFIDEFNCNKSSSGDELAKIIKITKKGTAEPITNCLNSSISTDTFPDELK